MATPTSMTGSPPSKYELQNSVSELFRIMNVPEGKNFNRETISERFEKNINRQSSKPFSLFFNRVADNQEFLDKYQALKCQNSNEVDPFVRFLVRVREDKNMNNFVNNYSDIVENRVHFKDIVKENKDKANVTMRSSLSSTKSSPTAKNHHRQQHARPTSATSVLLNMVNNSDGTNAPANNQISKSNTISTMMNHNHQQRSRSINRPSSTTNAQHLMMNNNISPQPTRDNVDSASINDNLKTPSTKSVTGGSDPASHKSRSVGPSANTHRTNTRSDSHGLNHSHSSSHRHLPPYLSRDYHQLDWPKENDCFQTLGSGQYSVQQQEQLLLRDLLFVLIGIEGRFIRMIKHNTNSDDNASGSTQSQNCNRYRLVLDPTTDHFLAVTTNRILKICDKYSSIIKFVESRVYGLVNQALVASIQQHLYDYNMVICQMEEMLLKNDLFLQKMFYILLPFFSTFSLLQEICVKLYKNKSVGGAVLTLLHEKTKSIQGMDNKTLELFLTLTKSAAIPYFDILKTWIYYGEIGDPRKEFFIEDNQQSSSTIANNHQNNSHDDIESDDEYGDDFGKFNDKYWNVRYRINSSKTPCFLKKHEQIIYKTGKYVSIIKKVKQLFMKSSKVIPLPHSFTTGTTTVLNSEATGTVGFNNFDALKTMGLFTSPGGGGSSIGMGQFANPTMLNTHYMTAGATTIGDNSSFASMASTSSSSSTGGGGGGGGVGTRGTTPAPASSSAALFTPKPEDIYYSFDESTYISPIISAYEEASSQLLHILIHESQLVETFNAVKHYMLVSMGDFMVNFMKFAAKDLCKRTDSVVLHRLDSMMGMALGISVCQGDRQFLKDDPHIEFVGKTFLKQIYQIMKPGQKLDKSFILTNNQQDPSPSSSYLLRSDEDAMDGDDYFDNNNNCNIVDGSGLDSEDCYEVALNRSIISSMIDGIGDSATKIRKNKYVASGGSAEKPIKHDPKSNIAEEAPIADALDGSVLQQSRKLFCYESLMLKFDVPFPLSLIFTQKSIVCYELLFRCVFLCRYAETELEETWKDNILNLQLLSKKPTISTTAAQLSSKEFKNEHEKAFALRYKMIAFVRNFHYFYAFEVIDPSFAQFIGQLTKRGSSLDSVIECHEKFLEHCFNSCFLTSIDITTIIIKIFTLCIEFSHVLKDSIDIEDQSSMMESSCFFGTNGAAINFGNDNVGERKSSKPIKEIINHANEEFDKLVNELLRKIYSDNCEYHNMYPFVARLDYNDFYRGQMMEA